MQSPIVRLTHRAVHQKILVLQNEDFFIQAAGLVSHHAVRRVYHQGRQSRPCISSRVSVHFLRLDEIQRFALVIYNSCGIDDMQGYALIKLMFSVSTVRTLCKANAFFNEIRSCGTSEIVSLFYQPFSVSSDIVRTASAVAIMQFIQKLSPASAFSSIQ